MIVKMGVPQPKQIDFLKDRHKYVAYGGARGGGKSWTLREKLRLLGIYYAGIQMLLVRRTYAEVTKNHLKQLKKMLKGIAKYNKTEKIFYFTNGSTLTLGYCASDDDADQYQGTEYDIVAIDEATQMSELQLKKIAACCRGVNDFPKHIYYTCNPGGQGHAYIKRLFIDRRYTEQEDGEQYSFISAKVTDNMALMKSDPEYMKTLQALPPKLRKAWLDGDWDIFEGQFFEDFIDKEEHYKDRRWTNVIEPFEVPQSWTIYRSYDHGYSKPFSCGYWAVDYEGRAYRILEIYGCTEQPDEGVKWEVNKIFSTIKDFENEHRWLKGKKIIGVADPAIWQKDTGESIADTAAKHGIYFQKGDHKRIPGWMQFHYRLAFDENGVPMCYIFKTCKHFIRTIPTLLYSETIPEDLDTKQEDHIADEARYFFMSNPIRPKVQQRKEDVDEFDPLNLYRDRHIYSQYNQIA